jgi:hypothetical protein
VLPVRALTDGFGFALGVGALFCLAGAIVAALLLRDRAKPEAAVVASSTADVEDEALAA